MAVLTAGALAASAACSLDWRASEPEPEPPPSDRDASAPVDAAIDAAVTSDASGPVPPSSSDASTCVPTSEVCDARDNDCDGASDERLTNECGGPCSLPFGHMPGEVCSNGLTGVCTRTGTYVCAGTKLVCSAPTVAGTGEVCDGIDNDCDGVIDDGATNECGGSCDVLIPQKPGTPCSNGLLGACARDGTYACRGLTTACVTQQVTPTQETCDGIDNDCDGKVDNDVPKVPVWFKDCNRDGFGDGASSPADMMRGCKRPEPVDGCPWIAYYPP